MLSETGRREKSFVQRVKGAFESNEYAGLHGLLKEIREGDVGALDFLNSYVKAELHSDPTLKALSVNLDRAVTNLKIKSEYLGVTEEQKNLLDEILDKRVDRLYSEGRQDEASRLGIARGKGLEGGNLEGIEKMKVEIDKEIREQGENVLPGLLALQDRLQDCSELIRENRELTASRTSYEGRMFEKMEDAPSTAMDAEKIANAASRESGLENTDFVQRMKTLRGQTGALQAITTSTQETALVHSTVGGITMQLVDSTRDKFSLRASDSEEMLAKAKKLCERSGVQTVSLSLSAPDKLEAGNVLIKLLRTDEDLFNKVGSLKVNGEKMKPEDLEAFKKDVKSAFQKQELPQQKPMVSKDDNPHTKLR